MPKADETITTPPRDYAAAAAAASQASAAVAAASPSIIDLGRHLALLEKAYEMHEEACLRCPKVGPDGDHQDGKALLLERIDGIRATIATMPASSLADAAVQVALCASIAGVASANAGASKDIDRVERMLLGAVPILAAAAGLDMNDMDWAAQDTLRVRRFAGVGVQS